MSHTTFGNSCKFIHNGDFSGSVEITDDNGGYVSVPFSDLKMIVAKWVRGEIIRFAENADDDEVLLRYQRLWQPK